MPERLISPPPGFDDLSIEEKLEYVQSLWDRIAAGEERVPIPDWHKSIVRERLRMRENQPEDVFEWSDVLTELENELRTKESNQ